MRLIAPIIDCAASKVQVPADRARRDCKGVGCLLRSERASCSGSASIGWRTRAGAACILGSLTFIFRLAFAATAAFATGAALSLARQRQPLQFTEVHPGQANR